jgi:hypothetical protein
MQSDQFAHQKVVAGGGGVFRPTRLSLRPDSVLRLHGYKNMETIRPVLRKAAETVASQAETIIEPEVHYRRLAVVGLAAGELTLEHGIRFHCDAFHRHLKGAREVVVTVATMGAALDREVIARLDHDRFEPLEALFLETCGWLAIELTTKQFRHFLRTLVQPSGYRLSSRMGPGYSYRIGADDIRWPLEDQKGIFEAFAGTAIPVRLLDSCAMLPKMSRSSIFGLLPSASDAATARSRT